MEKKRMKWLFIGDSITDVGRSYEREDDLGQGYVSIISEKINKAYPSSEIEIINRGISGNKISDLNQRIEKDCLALQPTVLSILVGINDTWHNVDGSGFGTATETKRFKDAYHQFLRKATQAGIQKIVLIEPFLLPIPADRKLWRVDLDPKIQAIRELALEFKTAYLPLDGLINSLGIQEGFMKYAQDGVHPTELGHQLIADEWLTKIAPQFLKEG